ncbi:MAG: hypothetical protein ABQ298_07880 [Puniceicoccaceae bacterium]
MKCRNILAFLLLLPGSLVGVVSMQAQDLSPDQFRATLDPYVGVWQGEYRIYSQEDELLNQFKVNRNYWWDGSVLMGRVSYDFGESRQTFFHRIILSEGVPFSFVTDSASSSEVRSALKGELLKGTLVWTRVMPRETLPVRISERIVESGDGRFIEFWGNQEAKDAAGASLLVRIEGFAAYLPESREFVVATESVDDPGLDVPEVLQSETSLADSAGTVSDRTRRLQTLDPDRRVASSSVDPGTLASRRSGSPVQAEQELRSQQHEAASNADTEPDEITQRDPEPAKPSSAPVEDPEIMAALQALNIVGINDRPGEQCIVVDYFLLYEPGDALDLGKPCKFVELDDQYLYFEDGDGYRYRLFRKDAVLP